MSVPLLEPRAGLPELITSESLFENAISELLQGEGPIAVDAERASGFKYSARAYLIQIYRRNGGLHLIDPIAIGDTNLWHKLNSELEDQEWIIHASTQDLSCLREVGIDPKNIFDTELGGRIAGCEKVGLGSLCESLLELSLAKEHSAVDWSTRPLKPEWLIYAALDVDVLVDLRDAVENLLIEQGKLDWAKEEFQHVLALNLTPERQEPWRRTSGMHRIRDRYALNAIKHLWELRDEYARLVDVAPGRIFNDETLMELISKKPGTVEEFAKILMKRTRHQDLPAAKWFKIFQSAYEVSPDELPAMRGSGTGLPAIKIWENKNPLGYARATHVRAQVAELAAELKMPTENLLSPDSVRKLCWPEPPVDGNLESYIEQALAEAGARPWQISAVKERLEAPLRATEPLVASKPEGESVPEVE